MTLPFCLASFGYHGNVPSLMKYYGRSAYHRQVPDLWGRYWRWRSIPSVAAGDDGQHPRPEFMSALRRRQY